jgi:hypothetical protein
VAAVSCIIETFPLLYFRAQLLNEETDLAVRDGLARFFEADPGVVLTLLKVMNCIILAFRSTIEKNKNS